MKLEGRVVSGPGRGRYFISLPIYYLLFTEILNEEPYLGTLNVDVGAPVSNIERLCKPQFVRNVFFEGKLYGGFRYWLGSIGRDNTATADVVVVRPNLSKHHEGILEVVSSKYLRELLRLRDGDYVWLELRCF